MTESGAYSAEAYRQTAAEFVCALALVFNRRELKAVTLWSRIGSAIETGVVAARGGDLDRFEDHCLRHVKASVSLVASSEDYARMTASLTRFDDAACVHFVRYLAEHTMPAIKRGRALWEARKSDLETARKELDAIEAADSEDESEAGE